MNNNLPYFEENCMNEMTKTEKIDKINKIYN